MAKNLAEMIEARTVLNKQIGAIERAETRKQMAAHVGKYLKYPKSCYSCPKKPSDYWPIYAHVVRQTQSGSLIAVTFQTTSTDEMTLRIEEWYSPHHVNDYIPITKRQYAAAKEKFVREVTGSL